MKDPSETRRERRLEAAAAATRVPASRVRYFVQAGLVRPSRTEGRVPYFGDAEMAQLRRIRRLRDDLGLNMAGIEVALRLLDEIESLRGQLGQRRAEAGVRVEQVRRNRGDAYATGANSERPSGGSERDGGGSNGEM